jgi:hypothetical protein
MLDSPAVAPAVTRTPSGVARKLFASNLTLIGNAAESMYRSTARPLAPVEKVFPRTVALAPFPVNDVIVSAASPANGL